jgi:release factor glutamine methyltransferase
VSEPWWPLDTLLQEAKAQGLSRLEARVLAAHGLGKPASWVHAHGDHRLQPAEAQRLREAWRRRRDGEPVAYITGEREFFGLPLHITPAVLDPRPDTETLVEWALAVLRTELAALDIPRVADLGTGSGAVALALASQCPKAHVTATDISADALAVARGNGQRLGLTVSWYHGDWLSALPAQEFDLVVSNPPYLAADDPHLSALQAEPQTALVSGDDGLHDLRSLVRLAPQHLAPGGWLLLEHGFEQGDAVASLMSAAGFADVAHRHDLAGHVRCTGGRWPMDAVR